MTSSSVPHEALTMVGQLSDDLAVPPPGRTVDWSPASPRWRDQSLSKGAAGVAVLHGVRAQQGHGGEDRVHAWLARATRDGLGAAGGAGLWFGAPAVAFALTVAAPGRYPQALNLLDDAVGAYIDRRLRAAHARIAARARPSLSEVDLVRGLTGLGAYLLRHDPHGGRLADVLSHLVRLTEPVDAADIAGLTAPGWWTSDVPSTGTEGRDFTHGYADFGMAHGISGPLALLALAMRDGVIVDGHADAIGRICSWLDRWRQPGESGPWWPERLTLPELRSGQPLQPGPARPSWCYGTPGMARAQQLAGIVLGDSARQHLAEQAMARCLADPAQLARLSDPALCHGWAGVALTAWCAAADARTPAIRDLLPDLTRRLLAYTTNTADHVGLIEGRAGIALTLHSLAIDTPTAWPTCLLLA
jgi:lantibiotic biosynthesis protein